MAARRSRAVASLAGPLRQGDPGGVEQRDGLLVGLPDGFPRGDGRVGDRESPAVCLKVTARAQVEDDTGVKRRVRQLPRPLDRTGDFHLLRECPQPVEQRGGVLARRLGGRHGRADQQRPGVPGAAARHVVPLQRVGGHGDGGGRPLGGQRHVDVNPGKRQVVLLVETAGGEHLPARIRPPGRGRVVTAGDRDRAVHHPEPDPGAGRRREVEGAPGHLAPPRPTARGTAAAPPG